MIDPTNHPLWAAQVALESSMASLGVDKFRIATRKAYAKGEATAAPGVRFVLQHVIEPAAAAITTFIAEAKSGTAGRRHTLVRYVSAVTPDVLAYLTSKLILDGFVKSQPLTPLGIRIGAAIEIEQRIQAFDRVNKGYITAVLTDLRQRSDSEEHRRRVIVGLLHTKDDGWQAWGKSDQLHVGIKLIELVLEATHIATIEKRSERGRTPHFLQLTDSFRSWVSSLDGQLEMLHPEFLPCLIPPKDWTSPTEGGYHTDAFLKPPTFVKARSSHHRELLAKADLSMVYRAVNAIQATPWEINGQVLAVLNEVIQNALPIGKLPASDPLQKPERPHVLPPAPPRGKKGPALSDEHQAILDAWKLATRNVYEQNEKRESQRVQVLRAQKLAHQFAFGPLYFPHQLDFRGRIYAIPGVLNPQGPEYVKALLHFEQGTALDTEGAQGWFMVHGANTYGVDKVGLDERIQWVQDNEMDILASAADPLGHLFWNTADSPFCFLAWCFEYAAWNDLGEEFLSRIPIALDGTCNGLQHYSAMLRDPIGGAATNLVPSDKPQDIYGEVAKVVMARLEAQARDIPDPVNGWAMPPSAEQMMANHWLNFMIDRKTTKRPVMVLPYGGTIRSCQEYTLVAVKEQIEAGKPNPFGPDLKEASAYLSGIIWSSIGDVVVAARAAMGWLMDCTRLVSHAGSGAGWTAPSGFPVWQAYPTQSTARVKTTIHGEIAKINLTEDIPNTIDKRRQASGVAPNFVHSMDAAALVLTVNLALDNGVTNFAMIHDSYGTSAGATDMLAACTRHAFVDMYDEHDVLGEFRDSLLTLTPGVELPSVPVAGGLDLQQVINSAFFFA